jgi:hypothetical protein
MRAVAVPRHATTAATFRHSEAVRGNRAHAMEWCRLRGGDARARGQRRHASLPLRVMTGKWNRLGRNHQEVVCGELMQISSLGLESSSGQGV